MVDDTVSKYEHQDFDRSLAGSLAETCTLISTSSRALSRRMSGRACCQQVMVPGDWWWWWHGWQVFLVVRVQVEREREVARLELGWRAVRGTCQRPPALHQYSSTLAR